MALIRAHLQKGDIKESAEKFSKARSLAKEIGDAKELFHASRTLGVLLCRAGLTIEGLPFLREALQIARRLKLPQEKETSRLIDGITQTDIPKEQ